MPYAMPRHPEQPRRSERSYPTVPVCVACGNRTAFRVLVPGRGVEIRHRRDCTPAMRLVGCGRCGGRHTIVIESAWD